MLLFNLFSFAKINTRPYGIGYIKSHRYQHALRLRQVKGFFKYRNEYVVTRGYKSPEKENRNEGAELRPFGLLVHGRQAVLDRGCKIIKNKMEKFKYENWMNAFSY